MIKPILIGVLTATGFAVCFATLASAITPRQNILLHAVANAMWADNLCPTLKIDEDGLRSVGMMTDLAPSEFETEVKVVLMEIWPYVKEEAAKNLTQYCETNRTLLGPGGLKLLQRK